jgi:CHAT domain-containing protein
MLAIGDPVYNAADTRFPDSHFHSARIAGAASVSGLALPRLTASAGELEACSRAWGSARTRVLSGAGASLAAVESALRANPSVIHFATHVIAGPGDHSSGLIALSLDRSGAMGLMGPTEIVAQSVTARLVVLNGCYSARGETLPSAGLLGLTRAWIGAGAGAVLATRWNIPDDAGQSLMTAFYRHLRASPNRSPAFALQEAQLELLRKDPALNKSDLLGAYFLLGRI